MIGPISNQPWQGVSSTPPFSASVGDNGIRASGAASAGAHGTFTWCTPYGGTVIRQFGVRATRYHASASIARLELGVQGAGAGVSITDGELPVNDINGAAAGRRLGDYLTENGQAGYIAAPCVWAHIVQTGAQTTGSRIWSVVNGYVILQDVQGPAVSAVSVSGPSRNGWFTGPVTISADQSDNLFDRGGVSVTLDGAIMARLGDVSDGRVSQMIDPGADGPHDAGVQRESASGEFDPALSEVSFQVDRTPPELSVDDLVVVPGRRARVSWSQSDDDAGVESASIQFRAPSGWATLAISASRANASLDATFEVPEPSPALPEGTYPVRVVAQDLAGNVGSAEGQLLVVDRTPPKVTAWSLHAYGGGQFGLTAAVRDAASLEIAPKARIEVNRAADASTRGKWITVASADMDSVIDTDLVLPAGLAKGRHRLRMTVSDDYGNSATYLGPDDALIILTRASTAPRRAVLQARFAGPRGKRAPAAASLRHQRHAAVLGRLMRSGKPLAAKRISVRIRTSATLTGRTDRHGRFRIRVPRAYLKRGTVVSVQSPGSGSKPVRIRLR